MNNANILMLNIWHDECVSHSYSCNPCNNSRGIYNYTYFVHAHTCDKLLSCVRLFATPWTACRLHCLWDVPGKNTGVGCHFFLQAIFPTQGSNLCLLVSPTLQADSLPLCYQRRPYTYFTKPKQAPRKFALFEVIHLLYFLKGGGEY